MARKKEIVEETLDNEVMVIEETEGGEGLSLYCDKCMGTGKKFFRILSEKIRTTDVNAIKEGTTATELQSFELLKDDNVLFYFESYYKFLSLKDHIAVLEHDDDFVSSLETNLNNVLSENNETTLKKIKITLGSSKETSIQNTSDYSGVEGNAYIIKKSLAGGDNGFFSNSKDRNEKF